SGAPLRRIPGSDAESADHPSVEQWICRFDANRDDCRSVIHDPRSNGVSVTAGDEAAVDRAIQRRTPDPEQLRRSTHFGQDVGRLTANTDRRVAGSEHDRQARSATKSATANVEMALDRQCDSGSPAF